MMSFLPIIFKLFFTFLDLLIISECFHGFFSFVKSGSKDQWDFAGPHYSQEILFDQCRINPSVF